MVQNLFTAKRLFSKETSSAYSSYPLLEGTIKIFSTTLMTTELRINQREKKIALLAQG